LDYVEPDWVWVQPMGTIAGAPRWLRQIFRDDSYTLPSQAYVVDDDDVLDDEMAEAEDKDIWVVVDVMRKQQLGVDQFTVEQPSWCCGKLRGTATET
jgi:hypothetical protein